MNAHNNYYGTDFNSSYFIILRELYETHYRLITLQTDASTYYDQIMNYFESGFINDIVGYYASTMDTFENTFNSLYENPNYLERIHYVYERNQLFMTNLTEYRNTLSRTGNLLQQIQAINPNFTLHSHDEIRSINVTPVRWFILRFLNPDMVWDSNIFSFEALNTTSIDLLLNLIGSPVSITPNIFQDILLTYSRLVNLQSPPIVTFSPRESYNVFDVERDIEEQAYNENMGIDPDENLDDEDDL